MDIRIANAPCSWGALEFELEGQAAGYKQVLDEIADTGYMGTELGDWGFMPTDPSKLRSEIDARGLELLGAFVPVALKEEEAHDKGIETALRAAGLMHAAGYTNAFIVLADENGSIEERTRNAGRISSVHGLDKRQLESFCKGAEKVARAVRDQYGIRTVFHHHCAGYIETPDEIDLLMENTDPDLLGLCFDTGHYRFGGGKDEVEILGRYWPRIWHLHFKDYSSEVGEKVINEGLDYFEAVKNGIFCELGKGDVEFERIRNFLEEKNYQGWIVVEQDVLPGMGNPKICARNNRQYLQSIGFD